MDNTRFLNVSETFYSIQGEGQTMGKPAVFLRLGGCNLLCKSKDWICDTIEVWQKSKKTPYEKVFTLEQLTKLRRGAHLVITGGEPLLHQKKLINFLFVFARENQFLPTIEIETNGTIAPEKQLCEFVDYWNVSPKLSNSGEPEIKRFNPFVIKTFNTPTLKTIFKFVVKGEKDVLELIDTYGDWIDYEKVYLMPAGATQEELEKVRASVINQCLKFNFNYSERLHIVTWNQKTGV